MHTDSQIISRRIGEKFTSKIVELSYKQPWYWNILNLAWSAGPVTFVALLVGSYLGYGRYPQLETFYYFAGYTLAAGLVAYIIGAIRKRVIQPKIEASNRQLTDIISQLFLLYFSTKNTYLKEYPEEERRIVASWWPLTSAASDMDTLQEAVRDITGDEKLARAIKRIEIYRRNGLPLLVEQECRQHQQAITRHVEKLRPRYPIIASCLYGRFQGQAPTLHEGQPRNSGFLERLLSAANNDSPDLLTLEDTLAALTLTLELLLGRVIIILHPRFAGHKKLEEAKRQLDAALSDFRLLRRKRNSRLRVLIRHLRKGEGEENLASIALGSQGLLELLQETVKAAPASTLKDPAPQKRFQQIRDINERMKRQYEKLQACETQYQKIWQRTDEKQKTIIVDSKTGAGAGLHVTIKEHKIALDNKQKVLVAEQLDELLRDTVFQDTKPQGYIHREQRMIPLTTEDYKQFAIDCVNLLDECLDISEPEEQLAIETSHQADFGCIEPGLADQTKVGWGRLVVEEIQETQMETAHRLAQELIDYFNLPLAETSIQYLIEHYGASEEYLRKLTQRKSREETSVSGSLKKELLNMPNWQALITTAK